MANYQVNLTGYVSVAVDAETWEEAEAKAQSIVESDPYYFDNEAEYENPHDWEYDEESLKQIEKIINGGAY